MPTTTLQDESLVSDQSLTANYPLTGERIKGCDDELEIALVHQEQPGSPHFYSVQDHAGVERTIYLDHGQWWLREKPAIGESGEALLFEEGEEYGDPGEEVFRAEMEALVGALPLPGWHERLEEARSSHETARAGTHAGEVYQSFLRLTIIIEIVNRLDPTYYEGKKR